MDIMKRAKKIKLVIFDVDGTLTDGRITYMSDGHEIKSFHSHDGQGIRKLQKIGITVAIVTARNSPIVEKRMQELGIEHMYQGMRDKAEAVTALMKEINVSEDETVFVGDDEQDIPGMKAAGLGIAVANATSATLKAADWLTTKNGGHGAAREVCELIIEAQK